MDDNSDDKSKKSNLAKLADQLNALDKKLDELKIKAASSAGAAKAEYDKTVDELQGKRKEIEEHLQKLKVASEEGWKELKRGTKKAIGSLNKSIDNAIKKFKK